MKNDPTQEQLERIADAIASGHKIEAVKLYRRSSGSDLKDSKDFVEKLTVELREKDPVRFAAPPPKGCLGFLFLLAVVMACSSPSGLAGADDVLYMGRYYRNVTVESVNGDKVKIHSKEGDAEIPWNALPPALQKASAAKKESAKQGTSAQGEPEKAALPSGLVRLRGHVKEKVPEGLLVECLEPMNSGTGKTSASSPVEPTVYGTFLLKGHPMEAYLVDNDPISVIGNPAGTFSKTGETFQIYSVAKADAR